MLVRRRHDLVARAEVEPGEHDVAAVGRRRRQRDVLDVDADERGDVAAELLAQRQECARTARALPRPSRSPRSSSARIASIVSARERPDAAGLQVGEPLEHGKLRAGLLEGHGRILTTAGSNVRLHARRPRRSARLHAAVRPRRSPPHSRAPGPTWSSSHRASGSARWRRRRATGARVVLPALVADGILARCDSR